MLKRSTLLSLYYVGLKKTATRVRTWLPEIDRKESLTLISCLFGNLYFYQQLIFMETIGYAEPFSSCFAYIFRLKLCCVAGAASPF